MPLDAESHTWSRTGQRKVLGLGRWRQPAPIPPRHPQGPVPSLLLSSGNKYGLIHSLWQQILSHLPSSNLVKPSCTPSYPPLTGSPVSHSGIAGEVWGCFGWLVTAANALLRGAARVLVSCLSTRAAPCSPGFWFRPP